MNTNPEVDHYFVEGCGRCPLGGTPECKIHFWPKELLYLRKIALSCGLAEELKWGMPVYTYQNNNLAMIAAFKDNCVISFFKGALLQDSHKILSLPGENTQSARVIRFTDVHKIEELESTIKAYIFEAIEAEKAGLKVEFKKPSEFSMADEFKSKLEEIPELKTAFEALSPGRQRGYLLHFSQPKQSKTRESRVENCVHKILIGKGLNE